MKLNLCVYFLQPTRDSTGAAIAVFTARYHVPQFSSHQTTLQVCTPFTISMSCNMIINLIYYYLLKQGIVYQLDIALENVKTQKCGLVFIYDMSDSKYSNFDYDLSQKILTLLKVSLLNIIYIKLINLIYNIKL